MVALWCHDWPVVALELALDRPVAVMVANRVVATSPAARTLGVHVGLRRREAQRACPQLELAARDIDREARTFDRVVSALEAVTPRVELLHPGAVVFPLRGPGRYFGGEASVLGRVLRIAGGPAVTGAGRAGGVGPDVGIAVADGIFTAMVAARRAHRGEPVVIPAGASPSFLARLAVSTLDRPELSDVLVRLGITTLGALAALPVRDVLARFGVDGEVAHRLARGLDAQPPALIDPPADLAASMELDPPAERVDQVAFAAKSLADDFCERLASRGHGCARVAIVAETVGGEQIERCWRDELSLTPLAIAQRIRWQLDGWLTANAGRLDASSGDRAVRLVTLRPEEITAATGTQEGFWGGRTDAAERALRTAERVVTLLGDEMVCQVVSLGGRSPNEQYRLVPLGGVAPTEPVPLVTGAALAGGATAGGAPSPVWPGRVPEPSPARVWSAPGAVELVDRDGRLVMVSGRGVLSATPRRVSIRGGPWIDVVGWAGPWTTDERWWDAIAHRRRARFQVMLADDSAHLLALEDRRWWLEATYD